jgi:hypothetical protein
MDHRVQALGAGSFENWKLRAGVAYSSFRDAGGTPGAPARLLSSPKARQPGALFVVSCAICQGAGRDGGGKRREGDESAVQNSDIAPVVPACGMRA